MTRTKFKWLCLISIALILGAAFFAFNKTQEMKFDIARAERDKDRLTRDLRAGAQVSADLKTLDDLTIDQSTSTKLDVLRYLGLEDRDVEFTESGQSSRRMGETVLFIRNFKLKPSGDVSYAEALRLVDWVHNNKAAVVTDVLLKQGSGFGDVINVEIGGTLYGLQKR